MGKIINLDRAVMEISGADAQKLLHDTLTSNLSKPFDNIAKWFALLAPQGKILVEGLISNPEPNRYLLDLSRDVAEDFFKRMRLYKMRANVELTMRDDLQVGWSATPIEGAVKDARADLGYRIYSADPADWDTDQTDFHAQRVQQAIMQLGEDFEANDVFPHDIGMDQLNGVDFNKGCYVGQEVVSRMQHRGTARKRPVSINISLKKGAEISCEGKKVGDVTSSVGEFSIGLVRLDKVSDPMKCDVDGTAVQLAVPHWASYDF
jgi:folate-binding protein YgfZ